MNKPIKHSKRSRKIVPGQGLVEFALALPILLLLIFGLIEFALIFTAWMIVENSARTAARYAVTGRFDTAYCSQFSSFTADPLAGTSCDLNLDRDALGSSSGRRPRRDSRRPVRQNLYGGLTSGGVRK